MESFDRSREMPLPETVEGCHRLIIELKGQLKNANVTRFKAFNDRYSLGRALLEFLEWKRLELHGVGTGDRAQGFDEAVDKIREWVRR